MEYTVRKGDTIAAVTRQLGTDWQTLKENNPAAVGRSSRNGNWFLREGRTISVPGSFQAVLESQTARQQHPPVAAGTGRPTAAETGRPTAVETGKPAAADQSGEIIHTLQAGETVWELAVKRYHVHPDEVLRLNGISDPRTLQVGRQLRIRLPEKSGPEEVVASWYGAYHHGLPMANGDPYDMHGATIAHKEMPLGTQVELENPRTGQKVRARVTDRGPYVEGRDVDLSYRLAQRLSLAEQGVGNLIMRVL